ncbi:hypothetical protein DOY81_003615, partial [Sarcophaga bullata]
GLTSGPNGNSSKCLKTLLIVLFISNKANFCPIQLRGPAEKGCLEIKYKAKDMPLVVVSCPSNIKVSTSSRISSFVKGIPSMVDCSRTSILGFRPTWVPVLERRIKSKSGMTSGPREFPPNICRARPIKGNEIPPTSSDTTDLNTVA